MQLSDLEVRRAKPAEKPYRKSDGRGLYLWVTPSGGKLWRWGYVYQGKEKLMSFGGYPDVPLALARTRHLDARRLLATGVDPMAQRKAEKLAGRAVSGNTFADVFELWMAHWKIDKSARHVDSVRRRMTANVLPSLGAMPIGEIEPPDLVEMLKTIDARGASDIAKRIFETSGQVFRYAIAHGHCKRNPAAEIRPSDVLKPTRQVNRARIDVKQLPDLLQRIEIYPGTHVTRLAMKLLALTFVRTRELIEAEWSEIDLEAKRWDIPPARMKMRSSHIVPLAKQTIECLEMLKRITGDGKLLFPGDRDTQKSMSNNTILQGLKRIGYQGIMTGHGFRGLASTILHEQGYEHAHIELQLAHAPRDTVSAAYSHALYLKPRSVMMQDWADFLEKARHGR